MNLVVISCVFLAVTLNFSNIPQPSRLYLGKCPGDAATNQRLRRPANDGTGQRNQTHIQIILGPLLKAFLLHPLPLQAVRRDPSTATERHHRQTPLNRVPHSCHEQQGSYSRSDTTEMHSRLLLASLSKIFSVFCKYLIFRGFRAQNLALTLTLPSAKSKVEEEDS